MRRGTRRSLIVCIGVGLILMPRLLMAQLVAEGKIDTYSDNADNYAGGGWISLAGMPPAPPVAPVAGSSPVAIGGDGAHWEFSTLTLNGTLAPGAAAAVSLKLSAGLGKNEHLVDPHNVPHPPKNDLPDIETNVVPVPLGAAQVLSAWAEDTHRDSQGRHTDYYTIGGTVSYAAGGVLRTLSTDDAWVRAGHGKKPTQGPMDPPGRRFGYQTFGLFDAELDELRILPGTLDGGVTPADPLWNAHIQEINLRLNGQDESGAWAFEGGHFNLTAPDIAIEGELDKMFVYELGWGESNGALERGTAVDGSNGASPWMSHFNAGLAGNADTGIPGTVYGAPTVWLNPHVDLAQLTQGFTISTGLIPMQLSMGLSLLEREYGGHGIAGDYNGDGCVDQLDYTAWREHFGLPYGPADGNRDGIVDGADYAIWRKHVGGTAGVAGSNPVTIPEPSMVALAMVGLCLAIPARQIRRARCRATMAATETLGDSQRFAG
jgi:hypothetical protein